MESPLKNLKEQVTCSICLDTYTKPKTIACLHTFCCECLERHALTSPKQGFYRCPECQSQICIPEGKCFDNLPSSFLHNSLLSLLAVRRSGEGNEISCGTCQKKTAEINYCFDCEKFMCPDCVKAQRYFVPWTQSHTSTTVSSCRLRGLVETAIVLLGEVPRERGNEVFLRGMSKLCLSSLY